LLIKRGANVNKESAIGLPIAGAALNNSLLAWEGTWTFEDLNIFLAGPTLTTPGVNMEIRGAPDETDRLKVIAYLRTLSDAPVPLP